MKTLSLVNFILPITLLIITNNVYSKPYIPNSGNEVLIVLDKSSQRSKFDSITFQLNTNKNNPFKLVKILQDTIELGKSTSDPRYIGFASSYVDRYLKTHKMNQHFKILKAGILQHDHKFNDAVSLLDTVINNDNNLPQANLLRASILQVQAKYSEAKKDCYSLLGKASHIVTMACISQVNGLTNNPERNYNILNKIVNNSQTDSIELSWAHDILAQLALQTNKHDLAEKHFKQGLKISPNNSTLLNAYADLLISKGNYDKVLSLLKHKNNDFTILLRLAIAEKFSSSNKQYKKQFYYQLDKMLATSDLTHQREISAFYLYVENNLEKAQLYALKNWSVQKELYDARLVLHCAIQSRNTNIAKQVINWYIDNSISDLRLNKLITLLKKEYFTVWTKNNKSNQFMVSL